MEPIEVAVKPRAKLSMKKALFFTATYAISFGCLIWVLKDIDYRDMSRNIARMHWGWVAVAMITDVLVYCLQGWRWSMLLSPLEKIPVWRSIRAIYVGLFANEVLPLRTGEIIRCYLQAKWSDLPFSVTLSSALIERIFDGLWLVACALVAVQIAPGTRHFTGYVTSLGVLILLGALLLGAAMYWKEGAHTTLSRNRLLRHLAVLIEDLHIIGHSRYLWWSAIASAPYLLLQVAPVYAVAQAYDVDLSITDSFILMVALRLSAVVPQAPGNLGLFQGTAFAALVAIGFEKQDARQFSFVLWAVITLPLLFVGFIALAITGSRIGELQRHARSSLKPEAKT